MSKKILNVLDVVKAVSYEMEVPKEVIFEAIEAALASATRKLSLTEMDVKVVIDRKTGDYETFRQWTVVGDESYDDDDGEDGDDSGSGDQDLIFDPNRHILLQDIRSKNPEAKVGDVISEPIESVEFGRIAAQNAKQVIIQKVREAKRAKVAEVYHDKVGQLITGIVRRTTKDGVILDLGDGAEVFIAREEMLPGEMVRMGDRLRAYLYEVAIEGKGPLLSASRARKEMLAELFRIEVPEIGEEVIEIKAIARDPGARSKVAVKSKDGRIDPIGACVGMRGARVQAISTELNGERIDVILWDDNPAQLVINALNPAEVASIMIDEDTKVMDIAVAEGQLSQAIGRGGQNVRLASQLSGWTLNVMSVEDAQKKTQKEVEGLEGMFESKLGISPELSAVLVREGFTSVEEIAYVPLPELTAIEELKEDVVQDLRERAKKVLEEEEGAKPADDLLSLEGMTTELAHELASHNIKTMEDLAEQSTDELLEIVKIPEDKAKQLIMKAREPWFK